MKKIVLRLAWPAATEASQDIARHPCVCVWPAGSPALPQQGDLAQMLALANTHFTPDSSELVLLLPAEWVSYTRVSLPARNQRQALQALPFMVEELLAEDIEDMHLATGTRDRDGQWPVVAIRRDLLKALLACCETATLKPSAVQVDAGLLPLAPAELHVLLQDERALLHSAGVMTAVDLAATAAFVDLLSSQQDYRSVRLSLVADSQADAQTERLQLVAEQCRAELAALQDVQVTVETLAQSPEAFLIAQQATAINLLQGEFAVIAAQQARSWWQVAAAVALVGTLGQFILQTGSGLYFNHVSHIAQQAAEAHYRKLFPDARQVSEPRKRLEYKLREAGDQRGDADFTAIFGSSMQALQSLPDRDGMSVQQLRYTRQRGELELELRVRTIEQMDAFKQALVKNGLKADITSANENDKGVLGRIQISTGAAS